MILYRFYINNVLIPEPENIGGWNKLLTNIKRDSSDLKGLLVSQDVQLDFIGTQYTFFRQAYFNSGICAEYTTLIEQSFDGTNYSTLHRGIIKLRDVVLKDMLKGIATAKINDNSFYARINNNKSIETNITGGWSKNGEPIGSYSQYAVTLFKPIDNTNIGTRQMHRVFDAMKYLVRFMSDGEVGFESTFLETTLPMMIQRGDVMRTGVQPSPYWQISFNQLFSNISKLRKIGWTIEYDSNENPIFRLEEESYFYGADHATDSNGNNIIFNNPEKLETYVNTNELYGQVKLGSEKVFDSPTVTYPESIQFNGFKEESFYILGQCNIDNTLDLVKDFIISSNVIEDIVVGASPDYDEDLILIVVDNVNTVAFTADAVNTNNQGTVPPAFYNMDLTNDKVANSFFFQGGLVAGFINFTTNDFQAISSVVNSTQIAPPAGVGLYLIDPFQYDIEIDPGTNFNLGTGYYLVPVTGFYTFNFYVRMDITGTPFLGHVLGDFILSIVDNLGVSLADVILVTNPLPNTLYVGTLSASVYRTAGDLVGTAVTMNYNNPFNVSTINIRILPQTKFSATATPATGGVVDDYDPQDIRNVFMKFKYPIEAQLFDLIKTQLTKRYSIYLGATNETFTGWIESISYPHTAEIADIILKTSVNTINPEIEAEQKYPSYKFEFDTALVTDTLVDMTYNSGGNTVVIGSDLTQMASTVENDISTAFGLEPITFNEIIVEKTSLGGGLFHYIIIIVNPDTDITIADVGGTNYNSSYFYY